MFEVVCWGLVYWHHWRVCFTKKKESCQTLRGGGAACRALLLFCRPLQCGYLWYHNVFVSGVNNKTTFSFVLTMPSYFSSIMTKARSFSNSLPGLFPETNRSWAKWVKYLAGWSVSRSTADDFYSFRQSHRNFVKHDIDIPGIFSIQIDSQPTDLCALGLY